VPVESAAAAVIGAMSQISTSWFDTRRNAGDRRSAIGASFTSLAVEC
jgi:hypothetical protein